MAFVDSGQPGISLAIVGASGAVGKDLISALEGGVLPLHRILLFDSPRNAGESTLFNEERIRHIVTPTSLAESDLTADVDVVVFACPPDITKAHAADLAEEGIAVVDVGGVLAGQIPLSVMGVSLHDDVFSEHRVICTPSAPALIASKLLHALGDLGVMTFRGQAMLSAGCMGRAGIDELSQQVAAMFNVKEPKRRIFPAGLAFDVISTFGASDNDWSASERRISMEAASVMGISPQQLMISLQVLPLFSGIILCGHLSLGTEYDLKDVEMAWEQTPGIQLSKMPPGPKRLVGRGDIYVGRLRPDSMGDGFHFWASADNLRGGAIDNVIALLRYYWDEGMI